MSKIIFLDCDGVLNSRERWEAADVESLKPREKWTRIDPLAVERLKRIVEATGAKIVVSSVWRLYYYTELRRYLGRKGLRHAVIGLTGRLPGEVRGEEIQQWMNANGVKAEDIVILDDDSDMGDLMPRLVKTTFQYGLLDEHVEQAIEVLNGRSQGNQPAG
jgi:hypothetical protein